MKSKNITPGKLFVIVLFLQILLFPGCDVLPGKYSEYVIDDSIGMNGSFEADSSGLPVNWLMYTPNTVPESDFDLVIDTVDFKDGKQSLKYVVRACSGSPGWYAPGFCNQFPAKPGEMYKISFWVKNSGSHFFVKIEGVGEDYGKYEVVVNSKATIEDWRQFEYEYTIPEAAHAIRIELSIFKPGTFWIDDLKIEKI